MYLLVLVCISMYLLYACIYILGSEMENTEWAKKWLKFCEILFYPRRYIYSLDKCWLNKLEIFCPKNLNISVLNIIINHY